MNQFCFLVISFISFHISSYTYYGLVWNYASVYSVCNLNEFVIITEILISFVVCRNPVIQNLQIVFKKLRAVNWNVT